MRALRLKLAAVGAKSRRLPHRARCDGNREDEHHRANQPATTGRAGTVSNIVIYEEDGPMRALLVEWLGDAGYRVRGSAAPVAAAGIVDLVIASIYMPRCTGTQCVRDIRAAHPATPLIAISGQFRAGLAIAGATAQRLGVDRLIAKPVAREDLLGAVRGIIGPPS
jgi:CheY-like chemotaxis protein